MHTLLLCSLTLVACLCSNAHPAHEDGPPHFSPGDKWSAELAKLLFGMRQYSSEIKRNVAYFVGADNFNCPVLRKSRTAPTSVHRLQPSDVKIIGAIGDSLTAGNGILARNPFALLIQNRGSSFSIGGKEKLSQQITLPNILKMFNKDLRGYSTGTGLVTSKNAKLNLAEPGSVAVDMPNQARNLVAAMKKSSSGVNFQKDWKIITVFVGGNDVCKYCKDKNLYSVANYKKNVQEALDILHKEVPRAFVNLIEVLDITLVEELKSGTPLCHILLGGLLCPCAANPSSASARQGIVNLIKGYQSAVRALASSGRYDTRPDFTVVAQPFFRNSKPPRRVNGKFDLKYFAPDCFHFSARGHAESARALWNNMLQPVGRKSSSWQLDGKFYCPTSRRPYLATNKN